MQIHKTELPEVLIIDPKVFGDERSILWNDPAIGIDWPDGITPLLSDKDRAGKLLADAELFLSGEP
jgi:dTDP-4-dehydrorhamnose 3,5-epimerase-like enzyme